MDTDEWQQNVDSWNASNSSSRRGSRNMDAPVVVLPSRNPSSGSGKASKKASVVKKTPIVRKAPVAKKAPIVKKAPAARTPVKKAPAKKAPVRAAGRVVPTRAAAGSQKQGTSLATKFEDAFAPIFVPSREANRRPDLKAKARK